MNKIEQLYTIFEQGCTISTDSRDIDSRVAEGQRVIFFALKGENFDANKFVRPALESGALCAVCSDKSFGDNSSVIVVDDPLEALQQLATLHRVKLNIPIIAITGSNGKTTTKELLLAVLSQRYRTSATKGNFNNHIGVPLTLLAIEPSCELAIVEMGANHHGEIAHLAQIARPDFGVITNIGRAHLEGFGSQEGVAKAKGELFDYLINSGGEIFRDSSCLWLKSVIESKSIAAEGLKEQLWDSTSAICSTSQEGRLQLTYCGEEYSTNLVGDYNRFNIIAAIEIGRHFEVEESLIKQAIESYVPNNSRSQMIVCRTNRLIVDTYNANPSSMAAALNNFVNSDYDKKIVIIGDMKELGEQTINEHIELLKLIEQGNFSRVMLVGDSLRLARMQHPIMSDWYLDAATLIDSLVERPIIRATVLVKGSNSMKLSSIIDYISN